MKCDGRTERVVLLVSDMTENVRSVKGKGEEKRT